MVLEALGRVCHQRAEYSKVQACQLTVKSGIRMVSPTRQRDLRTSSTPEIDIIKPGDYTVKHGTPASKLGTRSAVSQCLSAMRDEYFTVNESYS